jgi:hypothetical protein
MKEILKVKYLMAYLETVKHGKAWYMPYEQIDKNFFTQNCSDAENDENTEWVLIMPFNNQFFTENLNSINLDMPLVESVIFTYSGNPQITSKAPENENPRIISFAKKEELLQKGILNMTFPQETTNTIIHSHVYESFCYIMNPTFKFFITVICLWGLITIFHILWTWCLRKEYSKHIQKIMLFIPIFFLGYTLIDYVYYKACPWSETNGVQYLQIVQIALVTIFNTLFVGLWCFISKGWSIMRNSFTREELSSITMIVGIFYLVYSAYFIASDIPSLKVVIIVILIIMYFWVALTCLKNCIINIRTLKSHIGITGNDEVIMEALKLKKYLMVNFWIITCLFYFNKIIYNALYTFINENTLARDLKIANLFVEFVIISYMLFVFRARKWPEYFSLDIMYHQLGQGDEEQMPKSVVLNAIVPSRWVVDNSKMDLTLNGYEVNYLKIRNYRDPQLALIMESWEQDIIQVAKLGPEDFKVRVLGDLKIAVEEEESDESE